MKRRLAEAMLNPSVPYPPVLLVSGTDGVGKSTLIRALAFEIGAEVIHFGPPKAATWKREYLTPVLDHQHDFPDQPLILDRGFTEDRVWAQAFGRNSFFPSPAHLVDAIRTHRHYTPSLSVLFVTRSPGAIRATLRNRREKEAQIARSIRAQAALRAEYLGLRKHLPIRHASSNSLWKELSHEQLGI